ncbi:MAG: hypothetical protein HC767_10815 [Akkermansiaceae bacterium]|nr:hypothetical protein [Akkermansiaceae bacterium]
MVQILEDPKSRLQYAAKFFLSRTAYMHEYRMYHDTSNPLKEFLPRLYAAVEEGGLVDSLGSGLPPCLVMEKGEPLDTHLHSSGESNIIGSLQVRS